MPKQFDIEKMEHRSKVWLLVVSVTTLVVLIVAAVRENFLADWQILQNQYATVLKEKATNAQGRDIADQFAVHFRQNVVPELNKTDRCITCHLGIDDPRMADQSLPFKTHPGRYLAIHDPSKFGCTICHQGQGLATEIEDAHGRAPFWDYPLLKKENMKAACTRCHEIDVLQGGLLVQADADGRSTLSEQVVLGKMLAESKGCFGCHLLQGKGGTLGPDLTYVGDKTRHEFDFSHFAKDEPREIEYWLRKHFLEPSEISPGTLMPDMDLGVSEANALTAYMLSLRRPVRVPEYRSFENKVAHVEVTGKHLYRKNCASCHGMNGEQSEVPGIRTPALNNADALAAADADYYRSIILHGRSGSTMPAWGPGKGNLSTEEIDLLVGYIQSWQREGAEVEAVHADAGDIKIGRALFGG
ncbi:MAG: c-type cytochrome, partial [Candidatus Latescibacteria bacterium]|nr:c-type cytochrome [Candidatus Latescibacterota bacterium]